MATGTRLIIASNRLPFTACMRHGALTLRPTCGGLAAALWSVHERGNTIWVGWPGECEGVDRASRPELARALAGKRVVPIELSAADRSAYYDELCNGVLWPVFHYMIDRLPLVFPDLQAYWTVNQRFADWIVEQYRPGDTIWIHDYHLMLVPEMVREQLPAAPIGFFLHTPFPSPEIFRVLPCRRELLEGLLGSSVVGFQTAQDARHFGESVSAFVGTDSERGVAPWQGRQVRFGAYPIGIDPARLASPDLEREAQDEPAADVAPAGRRLLLGVDRLDYTKGIPQRLAAFDSLLDEYPGLRGKIQLLQVAVPSRGHVPAYVDLKSEVEAMVSSINATYGTADWTPVRYVTRAVPPGELARLYRAADVMLVTSLRDGMNLVAKEFVEARQDEDGVLVLSEFAGAADELCEALIVNPYSTTEVAGAIAAALAFDRDERRRRMCALRRRVAGNTVFSWVDGFMRDVARTAAIQPRQHRGTSGLDDDSLPDGVQHDFGGVVQVELLHQVGAMGLDR